MCSFSLGECKEGAGQDSDRTTQRGVWKECHYTRCYNNTADPQVDIDSVQKDCISWVCLVWGGHCMQNPKGELYIHLLTSSVSSVVENSRTSKRHKYSSVRVAFLKTCYFQPLRAFDTCKYFTISTRRLL